MIDLSGIPVIDNHVHPWRETTRHLTIDELRGHPAFSDAVLTSVRRPYLPVDQLEPSLKLFRDTNLGARYLLGELARFLDVDEDWRTVVDARNSAAEADYRAWTDRLFKDVGIDGLLVDEGGGKPRITLDELGKHVPARLWRVARTDNFIRDLLLETDNWPRFFERYQRELEAAIADGAIALELQAQAVDQALRRGLIMRKQLDTARVSTRARQRIDRILKQVPDGSSTRVRDRRRVSNRPRGAAQRTGAS